MKSGKIKKRLDFIGIGAQKSATTWISRCLSEHPEIQFPKETLKNNKELNFFNRYYARGYKWYHDLFNPFPSLVSGEFSVLYMTNPNVAKRIYQYNPNIKLVVSLREPISRAYSHHRMHIAGNTYKSHKFIKFEEALKMNPSYIEFGLYATLLKPYLQYFKRENIHIVFYDDIWNKPDFVIQELYKFLGVKNDYILDKISRKAGSVNLVELPGYFRYIKMLQRFARKHLPKTTNKVIKKTGLLNIKDYLINAGKHIEIPPIEKKTKKELHGIFSGEIKELEDMFNLNLSAWKYL